MSKTCTSCNKTFSLNSFYFRNKAKGWLTSCCKMCHKNKVKNLPSQSKTARKIRNKKYYEKNKSELIRKATVHYIENKSKRLSQMKQYRKANKNKIMEHQAKREKYLLKNDPTFRLQKNLRSRLNKALQHGYKTGSAIKDLGCSIAELKIYLESNFQPGMTWNNYGQWHVDHIRPLSSFDLTNPTQLNAACHYSNLQPLWAKDNLSKGASLLCLA